VTGLGVSPAFSSQGVGLSSWHAGTTADGYRTSIFCVSLPEVISVNPNKPECNGPFLIIRVPDFDGAKDGTGNRDKGAKRH
jgi:hypothetical protein